MSQAPYAWFVSTGGSNPRDAQTTRSRTYVDGQGDVLLLPSLDELRSAVAALRARHGSLDSAVLADIELRDHYLEPVFTRTAAYAETCAALTRAAQGVSRSDAASEPGGGIRDLDDVE